jgi:hypothetical protein
MLCNNFGRNFRLEFLAGVLQHWLQVYAVGTDKTIKQIKGSTVLREIDLHTLTLSSVVLSHNGNMLFTGNN